MFKAHRKLLASLAAVGAAAGIAGLGTYATFTSTTSAAQTTTSGTVIISLPTAGTATNRLTVAASGVVAGDTIQRVVDLDNTGNQNLASIVLATTASPTSVLDSDTTNGLQMVIDKCAATPWVEAGTSPNFTYTCAGGAASVLTTTPVIGASFTLAGLAALTAAGTDHLRVTLTLPTAATTTLAGKTSTITYTFTGTQRAATAQ